MGDKRGGCDRPQFVLLCLCDPDSTGPSNPHHRSGVERLGQTIRQPSRPRLPSASGCRTAPLFVKKFRDASTLKPESSTGNSMMQRIHLTVAFIVNVRHLLHLLCLLDCPAGVFLAGQWCNRRCHGKENNRQPHIPVGATEVAAFQPQETDSQSVPGYATTPQHGKEQRKRKPG